MNRTVGLILGATLLAGGCAQCPRDTAEEEAAGGQVAAVPAAEAAAEAAREDSLARVRAEAEEVRRLVGRVMNFDFDRSTVRTGQDTEVLDQKLAILQANPALTILITGHCDERGPGAYNMALGERRARSAKRFLTDRGIAETRITTRSMGEEQPVDPGRNEAAWARNRRSEFTITAGGETLRRP
jgi:peptidoglycan-associated lipoprotein